MADVILGGITLNRSLQWTNRYIPTNTISQKHARSVNGTLVIFQKSYPLGESITLSANGETGWFTKDMVDAIMAIVGILDNPISLDYRGEIVTVMFDWSKGVPATFNPIKPREGAIGTDWFTGEIKLLRT